MKNNTISDIVIIGGGYSGTLTAVNLLNIGLGNKDVIMIDSQPQACRGLAYGTWDDNLLLNVPAGNMSALYDVPNHFLSYCQTIDPAFNEGSFVSRRIYGDYLEFTLSEAEQSAEKTIQRITGTVQSVRREVASSTFCVTLLDGSTIQANKVILALGHFQPKSPIASTQLSQIPYIQNPWDISALDHVRHDLPILILGTGLTAIDALFRITSTGHSNVILMSRKGLLPQAHRSTPKPPTKNSFPEFLNKENLTVRQAFKALRESIRNRSAEGEDWRDSINELRPYTPEIWSKFSIKEKKRFLRHAVGFWDIHRHRLPPVAHNRLEKLITTEQATVLAARLKYIEQQNGEYTAVVLPRGSSKYKKLPVGAVINCTGPNTDVSSVTTPLVKQLLTEGLISKDEIGLGIQMNDQYEVIDADKHPISGLFYVGPMLKSKYWEAIAVPELRRHTNKIAHFVL